MVLACHSCKQLFRSVPEARLFPVLEVCHTIQYLQIARNNTSQLHTALLV